MASIRPKFKPSRTWGGKIEQEALTERSAVRQTQMSLLISAGCSQHHSGDTVVETAKVSQGHKPKEDALLVKNYPDRHPGTPPGTPQQSTTTHSPLKSLNTNQLPILSTISQPWIGGASMTTRVTRARSSGCAVPFSHFPTRIPPIECCRHRREDNKSSHTPQCQVNQKEDIVLKASNSGKCSQADQRYQLQRTVTN
jgi:hypothetical protein